MQVINLIQEIADNKLEFIKINGHAMRGYNGPYNNQETPVRNSAHWIHTYAYLWKTTNQIKYYKAIKILARFLVEPSNYGKSGSICVRKDKRFDKTNGLIGQAWVIEALVKAAEILDDINYYEQAKKLFLLQPFNKSNNMWEVLDCNGEICYDTTFNHQLWFAASGSIILDFKYNQEIDKMIKLFLKEANEKLFTVYDNGLIVHVANYKLSAEERKHLKKLGMKRKFLSLLSSPITVVKKKVTDKMAKYAFTEGLEKAYHLFDLYGFAILKSRYGEESIFSSEKFKKAVEYALCTDLVFSLMEPCGEYSFNKFAFGYNSPAFEYPLICKVFGNPDKMEIYREVCKKLLEFQIMKVYDPENHSFMLAGPDSETLDARVYELIRVLEVSKK